MSLDRDALAREMLETDYNDPITDEGWNNAKLNHSKYPSLFAPVARAFRRTDIALRHIAAARAEALEEAAKLCSAWATEGGQRVAIFIATDIRSLMDPSA